MQPIRTLTVTFDADLGTRLAEAAERSGLSPADLVLRAVRNDLDGVTAYARITDEVNLVKDGLAALAGLVGEVLAEPPPDMVGSICRYNPAASSHDP
ncbi:ribbon-helix-helix domain-containing protein [Methylobacterium mesophilicum]